ncbi:hypothetical protein [Variovorax sp. UMC13]|uniref:hypothetical protein n=1 Tax=Variovorax sp. UMC13 TaxID=1862326 RepID=UPI0016022D5E|nr:hypothetical protein [Variovorax sp. UMC13]
MAATWARSLTNWGAQNVKAGAAAVAQDRLEGSSLEANLATGLTSAFLNTMAARLASESAI